jgi:cytoskeletal protein CcmA (bactofilin family)
LSFFKKKRFGDVEGYERISRLIEDRQRELTGEGADEALDDEDTVLLSPQPRATREEPLAESVTLLRASETPDAPRAERERPESPFAPPTAPVVPAAPAPRVQAPSLPAVSSEISLVSKDAVWDGKLSCTGDVRIEGVLEGEVETTGTLFVAAEARVHGTVRARNVMLAGEIEGQLRCDERLEILPGGSARGEIDTGSLVVHEGAFIESKFQMHRGVAGPARA